MGRSLTFFLSAGEASGDAHGAKLIESLRRRFPDARFVGLTGPRMAEAGCESIADATAHASMLAQPVLKLGYYVPLVLRLKAAIRKIRPDVLIPIDSPALNWHLASTARACGVPVVYYICPQVWAWAPWRVKKLARLTDAVACILPFEQRYLRDRGVNATYVGHPLFDTLPEPPDPPPDILDAFAHGTWRVALLPGSRPGEIRWHSRALLACAERIRRRFGDARCTFCAVDERAAELIRRQIGDADLPVEPGRTREILAEAHFAVTASGTATLEVAHFGTPMVVFYRGNIVVDLLHLLGRPFGILVIPHYSLVNILAGHKLVPELMPWRGNVRQLIDTVMEVMDDLGWLLETRRQLQMLTQPLCAPNGKAACDNAADLIVRFLPG